jgi:hypothetical protein
VYEPAIESARIQQEQDPAGELDVEGLVEKLFARFSKITEIARDDLDRLHHILDKQPDLTVAELRELLAPKVQEPLPSSDLDEHNATELAPTHTEFPNAGDEQANGQAESQSGPPVASVTPPRFREPASNIRIVDTPPVAPVLAAPESPVEAETEHAPNLDSDPRAQFQSVLREFAATCGLSDCLIETEAFPLWFIVNPPVLQAHEPALDTQAANGDRPHRYFGWWWLAFVSKQNTPAGLTLLPDGPFSRLCIDNDTWEQACLELLGEPVQPDQFYRIVASMCDPYDVVGPLYLKLIHGLRQVREAFPERFMPEFWIKQGVDPQFTEEV